MALLPKIKFPVIKSPVISNMARSAVVGLGTSVGGPAGGLVAGKVFDTVKMDPKKRSETVNTNIKTSNKAQDIGFIGMLVKLLFGK